jgi:hypothetical protein
VHREAASSVKHLLAHAERLGLTGTASVEHVLLSNAFYDELRRHPVLVDRAAI